ncbi:helix-turn-helix domain-containing protein [Halogeometricum limi]|uniref:Predicted DNA binding protein, contains HTH domain n=1 Tax=Halogeometricum limi TaxID=555875 RepID=A0A1I6G184_9EURY|nr:helix-turn-helix domain-containing protein [Halogeometricum limi]SFR35922.1 Predicted DNA binding protein, contains HTH domain [Halogeometricum limi]
MKSLRVRLALPEAYVHPMHAFVADTPGFRRTSLLLWNPDVGAENTLVFHVDGDDVETYTDAVARAPSILDYEVATVANRPGFYLAVHEGQRDADATLVGAFVENGVVVVPPVVYHTDRSVELSLVGAADAVERTLDGLPSDVFVDVRSIHDYDGRVVDPVAALSPRQRDALVAAVELGYYGDPRAASVGDVADRIDCSSGTAAEHLRKAEATVLRRAVRDAPARW